MCVNGRAGEASSSKLSRNRARRAGALAKGKGLALSRPAFWPSPFVAANRPGAAPGIEPAGLAIAMTDRHE